jgi:membrane protein DedA with SNARE-associated domain
MLAGGPFALCLGLFFLSLLHEETGIVAGGYLVSEQGLHPGIVALVLILGLVVGDWGVYGLGAAARRVPRLRRWVASPRGLRSRDWLDRHLFLVVAVARLFPGPGVLFPTFTGLGLMGVSFLRFALWSAAVAAFYAPAGMFLTILYGDMAVPRLGWWAWPLLAALSLVGIGGAWACPLRRRIFDLLGLDGRATPGAR